MSVKHIGDLKKTECYGCSACVYSCPFGAITMEQDREGFRYPVVDEEKCTGCGRKITFEETAVPADFLQYLHVLYLHRAELSVAL